MSIADDSDNLVLRYLREMRQEMREGFDDVRVRLTSIETVQSSFREVLFSKVNDTVSMARRLEALEEQNKDYSLRIYALEAEVQRLRQAGGKSF